jgi:3-oxoacyl-[acyl-carrier-protein] synthase-3
MTTWPRRSTPRRLDRRAHRHPSAPQGGRRPAGVGPGPEAAQQALENAGKTAADVDLIIVATTTPDLTFPATAVIVQRKLGAPIGIAFDVQAVCSGFVYALSVADGFVARGHSKCALVIGAEAMTRLMDWTDRGTCVLFGDGAGAVVLEPREGQGTTADQGLLGFALRADGTKQDLLYVDGGPSTTGTVGKLRMLGNQVFKHAVINISEAIHAAAKAADVAIPEVDWFIPHQANQRILAGVAHRVGIDEDKVISTVALITPTPRPPRSPWPSPRESPTAASSRASCCCSRRWAAD